MVPRTKDELVSLLARHQVVSRKDLAVCQKEIAETGSVAEVLELLQRRQLLTPFQIGRIEKGEIDGLVLGGCKLMYRNASGSFARVYRACTLSDGKTIGVKLLRQSWADDEDTVKLFHREGEIGKRLRHPNIVPIFETGNQGKHHYITMEFVEGGNLRDFLNIRKQLSVEEACQYVLDMSRGLEYALSQGVTHRDLKLTNVLMSSHGVAKLIDFGLGADDHFLNRPGAPNLAQALEYSTLERNTNAPKNDPRSDLFFLGTILYELLTGSSPYPRTRDRDERKQFSRYRDIVPIASVLPNIPWRVASLLERLLQVNPEIRIQSAGEVATEVKGILRELGHALPSNAEMNVQSTKERTLLCIEHRPKRQDVLREYFGKHGYRVLLLGDADRALNRLKNSAPDCLLMFGDVVGEQVVEIYQQALSLTQQQPVSVIAILSKDQIGLKSSMVNSDARGRVMTQPVQLRDLRSVIEESLEITGAGN